MSQRVIVIGAGIIGASFAYHLAKSGADVRLIDGAAAPGGVATPNSWAWINASWGNAPAYFHLRLSAMQMWRDLDRSIPGLNANWCGGLLWDLPEVELLAYVAERQSQGYDLRVVEAAEIARLEPNLLNPPKSAVHAPQEGSVEPTHAVEKLLTMAQSLGADVLMSTGVRWIMTAGNEVKGVMTNDGPVEADVVVVAAGVGSRALLQDVGFQLALDDPPGLLVHTNPQPEILNGLVMSPELHVRQSPDGRLIAGTDFGGTDPGQDPDAAAQELLLKLQHFFKGGSALQLERYTLGYRPTPRDGVSAVGAVPGIAGLYLCVTHSGITLAPALGAYGAAEIMGQGRHELLGPFAPDRLLSAT